MGIQEETMFSKVIFVHGFRQSEEIIHDYDPHDVL